MNPRSFWLVTAILLVSFQRAAAQQPTKLPVVGYLSATSSDDPAFRQGLRELGYVEGRNVVIEWRFAQGKLDRLPDLAAELVRIRVNVIVVAGGNAASAAKKASSTIPIVIASASDPVGSGLVANLARPGGNVTGLTLITPEVNGKRLELLKEVVPGLSRVAALVYQENPAFALQLDEIQEAARSLGLKLQIVEVQRANEFESAFEAVKNERAGALNVLASAFFSAHRKGIIELAAKYRVPAVYHTQAFVENGGLIFYGPTIPDLHRRAATYVDKILKGARPADLPVEQPTKFELVINLKTAKQIGLIIPPNVLARADRVIK